MWDVCLLLAQIAIAVFIIDCIFQMCKDFFPSMKTVFGILAAIAGIIGLSHWKKHLDEKRTKENEAEKEE